jgi:hypothetical protein
LFGALPIVRVPFKVTGPALRTRAVRIMRGTWACTAATWAPLLRVRRFTCGPCVADNKDDSVL